MSIEKTIPITQKYLIIEGIMTQEVSEKFKNVLPLKKDTEIICFVDYAYADIAIGTEYTHIFCRNNFST